MVHDHDPTITQLLLQSAATWASRLNVPWFLAGAGLGIPAAIGTVATSDGKLLAMVSGCDTAKLLCGICYRDFLSLAGGNKQSAIRKINNWFVSSCDVFLLCSMIHTRYEVLRTSKYEVAFEVVSYLPPLALHVAVMSLYLVYSSI